VDIPDPSADDPILGDPNHPATWKGPWISITAPNKIAKIVTKANNKQYHQAHLTPVGTGR